MLPVTKKDVEISLYFYKEYGNKDVSPRDIIHVATMLNNGVEKLISVDKRFDVIEEVDRIDPSDLC